jgi:ubiquinone/menaquinone biosynthesis C-methylase UbiE
MRAFKDLYLTVNRTMHAFRHGRHGPLGGGEAVVNALSALDLKEGMTVADLGSGPGRFAIPIAKAVGAKGKVYAIDIDEGSLKELSEAARSEGLSNVETIRADLTKGIPLPESHLDLVFMANVLHDLVHSGTVTS